MKLNRILLVFAIVIAFSSLTFAANYWVIRDASGKLIVVESQPTDPALIVKGPFPTRNQAEIMITGRGPDGDLPPAPIPGSSPRIPGSAPASPPVASPPPAQAPSPPGR